MKEGNYNHAFSRRKFIGSTVAATASVFLPGKGFSFALPDTTFRGVRIGVIAPFSFRGLPGTADDVLGYLLKLGMTTVELMSSPIEVFAGAPAAPVRQQVPQPPAATQPGQTAQAPAQSQPGMNQGAPVAASGMPAGGFQRTPLTPEQQAAQDKYNADLKAWRASVPMTKFAELRKKYNDAGVNITLVKFDPITTASTPEELDYFFNVARTLGASGITTTLALDRGKILGPYADKHKMWVGFHNQSLAIPDAIIDELLAPGKYLGLNLDVGHYLAENNLSPVPVIKKYKDRIVSLHLTDRKMNNGASVPFGEGETPIIEILELCVSEKYPFGVDIDLDYQLPAGSDGYKEVEKCVEYCRKVLS